MRFLALILLGAAAIFSGCKDQECKNIRTQVIAPVEEFESYLAQNPVLAHFFERAPRTVNGTAVANDAGYFLERLKNLPERAATLRAFAREIHKDSIAKCVTWKKAPIRVCQNNNAPGDVRCQFNFNHNYCAEYKYSRGSEAQFKRMILLSQLMDYAYATTLEMNAPGASFQDASGKTEEITFTDVQYKGSSLRWFFAYDLHPYGRAVYSELCSD